MKQALKHLKNMLFVVVILMVASRACAASLSDGESMVGRQNFVINGPAGGASGAMAGGPIMGNGDVGVMLSGPAEELIFYIGKNDSWGRLSQSVMAVGQMRIRTPALGGATLKTTVDMQHAELRGDYVKGNAALTSRSWIDANRNLLCVELSNTGTVQLAMTLQNINGSDLVESTPPSSVKDNGTSFVFEPDAANPSPDSRKIAVAIRILGNADASRLMLEPGKTAVVVAVILSDLDCKGKDPMAEAQSLTAALTPGTVAEYGVLHRQWWQAFWSKSSIEIPDKVLEQHWYAAQYIMASCSRAGKVAPGLWGNWLTTDKPGWHGDFHLNYNFQAPYFGVYAANHADVSLPFYQAMNEFVPRGRKIAEKKGWKGVHFPVSIGPWGMCPEGDDSDWGQRSNAAYAALNFIWYYQYTQDKEWLRKSGYPFLREVADFWEDYLKLENGRYVIYNDSMHEGSGPDMNNLLSLGLVRTLFKNMGVMSADLGVDENRRAKWQDICWKLSAFPTQERNDKTVFRYTEKGMDWCDSNTLGIQHIFPAGAIGLDSDPKLLEISRNMINAMGRWSDGNGFATWYTACARVGHDPRAILAGLRTECDKRSMSNRLLSYGGGGIENCAGFNAINEMLLQSQVEKSELKNGKSQVSFVIRLFPCWSKDMDAKFGTLRTVGAFLVSAEMKNGIVSGVKIVSEKGRDCTVVNPWPGKKVTLVRNRRRPLFFTETKQGESFSFKTTVNETIELSPEKSTPPITTTLPSLDELAGDWMEVNTIRNFPSVNNFWGTLQTNPNLTAFLVATLPPYANGGESGVLTLNGKQVHATGSRWYPYQVLRRGTMDGVELASAIRMPFEQRGVFCQLTFKNTATNAQTVDVSWAFSGQVCRHPDAAWANYLTPHGEKGNTIALAGTDSKVLSAVGNKGSEPAAIAFAFSQAPADLKVVTDGGVASWKILLAPNQTVSLGYTAAMDKEPTAAAELATRWAKSFDQSFALAKTQWEERWQAAFTPGNTHFSGHLPTLLTDDPTIRRVYYEGALAPLILCRSNLPAAKRCFVTCGPNWAVTLMYFWDTEMWANAWAMLEPDSMKEVLAKWLTMDHHGCYALDCVSGRGVGPWYAANDWSIFRCVDAYLGVTGDKAFLSQVITDKTVLQRLEDIATFYEQRPLTKDSLLADYGGPGNLLECSERYVEGVASLNAANVYMLRRVADYCKQSGNAARAQDLRAKADKLLPFVMALYKPGEGVWNARDKAGKEISSRHCFDYIMTGQALENDLTPTMKTEMTGFVERELLTKTWMRAMSLKDPAAAHSDRPDHGPMGSYDGWPPLTMDVMCRFGTFDKAVNFLRAVEPITREGPFAQSHEFFDPDRRGFDPVVRIASRGYQDFNEGCGAAFAEVIIRSFFGYRPDLPGEGLPLLSPNAPRGFNGQLRHVPFHGKLYTLTSDAKGLHQRQE